MEPTASFSREHEGVGVLAEVVAFEVVVEDLGNERGHGHVASSGVGLGLGAVTADLGRGLEDP